MDTKRGYKYRLYPSKRQLDKLSTQLNLCKDVYNKLLESCIEAYKKDSSFRINRKSLNLLLKEIKKENPKLGGIYSQVLQNVFDRVIKAYENFFRRVEEGNQKPGFPKFKQHYKSITYPQDNGSFKIKGNKLLVSKIGELPIIVHRELDGNIKTLTLERNQANQWFAVFSAEKEEKDTVTAVPTEQKEVGIDRGLISLVAVSDGTKVAAPKFFRKAEKRLKLRQRQASKKKKGSNNRRKAVKKPAKQYFKVTNQREDFLHKLTVMLVRNYTFIAVEKLLVDNMRRDHNYAKSISDAAWSKFLQLLKYKAESAGIQVIEVEPMYTSQECSDCGYLLTEEESLDVSERTFKCPKCNLEIDRDINAAINILKEGILKRARAGLAQSNAGGDEAATSDKADASIVEETGTTPPKEGRKLLTKDGSLQL